MLSQIVFVASALAALANAQTIETSSASSVAPSSTVAQSMPPQATQAFDANNVTSSMKFDWCIAQLNTCPQICGGSAADNRCDNVALQFSCVCANGTVPDSSAYSQTLPFFICQETYIQCIARSSGSAQADAACRENQQCGTRNATAEALAQTSGASTTTASETGAGASATSAAGSATSSAAPTGAASQVTAYTSGAFAALLMAGFKLLL